MYEIVIFIYSKEHLNNLMVLDTFFMLGSYSGVQNYRYKLEWFDYYINKQVNNRKICLFKDHDIPWLKKYNFETTILYKAILKSQVLT
jgi:hypothetical protein